MSPLLAEPRFAAVRARTTDLGFLELDEMPALMKRHDVFLCPSRYDGWGMVVPEALAAGMPVIATDEMGSVLDIGAGHDSLKVCRAGEREDLARNVEWFIENVGLLPQLGRAATSISESYDAPVGAARFAELVHRALYDRGSTPA